MSIFILKSELLYYVFLVVIITSCLREGYSKDPDILFSQRVALKDIPAKYRKCQFINEDKCILQCSHTTSDLISTTIRYYYESIEAVFMCFTNKLTLQVSEITFSDNIMTTGWWTANDIRLKDVTFILKEVEAIKGSIFENNFEFFSTLTMRDMNICVLSAVTFDKLSLSDLTLDNIPLDSIEKSVLAPLKDSLTFLELKNIKGKTDLTLFNITGCVQLARLQTLRISNAIVKAIESNSLQGLSSLVELNITSCQLEVIAENAFASIYESIRVIDLSKNYLTFLDSNLVAHLAENLKLKFFLDNNLWNCKLMTKESLDIISEHSEIFKDWNCTMDSETSTEYDDQQSSESGNNNGDGNGNGYRTFIPNSNLNVLFMFFLFSKYLMF